MAKDKVAPNANLHLIPTGSPIATHWILGATNTSWPTCRERLFSGIVRTGKKCRSMQSVSQYETPFPHPRTTCWLPQRLGLCESVWRAEHSMAVTTVSACVLDEEAGEKIERKYLPSRLIGLK